MTSDNANDAELLAACRRGEQRAWHVLVMRYRRLVYAIALRSGLDEAAAADVFQIVFERLHRSLDVLQRPERLQAWLVTTAKREAQRQSARGRRWVSLDDDATQAADMVDDGARAEEEVADLQELNRLRVAFDALDKRCRDLLRAVFADGAGDAKPAYQRLSERLGMPMGSLGPTRSRCLEKLRLIHRKMFGISDVS